MKIPRRKRNNSSDFDPAQADIRTTVVAITIAKKQTWGLSQSSGESSNRFRSRVVVPPLGSGPVRNSTMTTPKRCTREAANVKAIKTRPESLPHGPMKMPIPRRPFNV